MVTGSTAGDIASNTTTKLAWTERAFPYLHLKLVIAVAFSRCRSYTTFEYFILQGTLECWLY